MEALRNYQEEQLLIKLLRDKAFNIAQNPKYHGYQKGIAPVFNNFLNEKNSNIHTHTHIYTHTHTHTHTHTETGINFENSKNYLKNFRNKLLENLRNEKNIHLLYLGC